MLRHRRERHGLDYGESVQSQTKSATDQSLQDMEGGDKSEDESEESDDDDDDEATYYNLWTYLRNSSTKDPDMGAKLLDLKERLNDGEMEDEELKKHRLFSDVTAMTLSSS